MTIEQLEAFVAAVRSDAYALRDASNKRVEFKSQEIAALEEEFGTPLVEVNSAGHLVLTDAGTALMEDAVPLIRQYRLTLKKMDSFRRVDTRPIIIGTLPLMDQYRLTRVFERFSSDYPDAQIIFEESGARNLLSGLQQGYYDGIIINERMVNLAGYVRIPMASDELAVIVNPDHPMAEEGCITPSQLSNEHYLLADPVYTTFGRGMQILKDRHVPEEQIEIREPNTIFDSIRDAQGVTIMPISTLMRYGYPDLVPLPFKPRQGVNIVFAYNRDIFPTKNMENLLLTLQLRAKALPI